MSAAAGGMELRRHLQQARRGAKVQERAAKSIAFSRNRCLIGAVTSVLSLACIVRIWELVADDPNGKEPSFKDEFPLVSPRRTSQESKDFILSKADFLDQSRGDERIELGKVSEEQWTSHKNSSTKDPGTAEIGTFLELRKEIADSPPRPTRISTIDNQPKRQRHDEAYHSIKAFLYGAREMASKFKVFVYPYPRDDPFRKIYEAVDYDPSGNYASESYFKKALMSSHFVTKDPKEADLFYLPFSISGLRNDRRVSVGGIQGFIEDYMHKISNTYPYWNRTGGADHFYVVCHSVGRTAMEKALQVRVNAIQVVCSSNYHVRGYIPHKDVPIPQIWPRKGTPAEAIFIKQRKALAFFAGGMNSPVRKQVVKTWANDSDIVVHSKRISTPYSEALLTSKFCLHVKGYEVNTARIGDAMYYGCVPVVISDYYDLPFNDILDWSQFSVIVRSSDIPRLKTILRAIPDVEYARMHSFVMKIRKHFEWHSPPEEHDAFYTVMYELWLRRHVLRFPLS